MSEPERINPHETNGKVISGDALLVCAYDSDERFKTAHLEGAISLSEFKSKVPSIQRNQEIVFYCA